MLLLLYYIAKLCGLYLNFQQSPPKPFVNFISTKLLKVIHEKVHVLLLQYYSTTLAATASTI